MRSVKPWYRRVWFWTPTLFVVLFLAGWAVLQPLAAWETRRAMRHLKGFRGDFELVHVSLIPLRYVITHAKLSRIDAPEHEPPMAYAKRAELGLDLRKLLHGKVVAQLWVDGAKLSLVEAPARKSPAEKSVGLGEELMKLTPLDVDRIEVKNSEIVYVLGKDKGSPELWLHKLDATVENLATRANMSEGTTTLALSGTLQRTGELSLFVTADPLEKQLTFSGMAALKGLEVNELYSLMDAKTDLKLTRGTLDVLARFAARDGRVTGGVKPVLKGAKVETNSSSLWNKLKAGLVDAGLKLFSDRVPNRNAVATVIPIKGDIKTGKAKTELWPTVLGVVRNAFVEGISESFRSVPAPTANQPQGPLSQARRALSKKGGVPLTQPAPEVHQSKEVSP